jgi:TolB-like protein
MSSVPPLPARPGLFAELRRRNVIRMAGLYLVGAWLVVQVAETLLPIFDAPGWVLKVLVGLLALGFVPALVFSWVYELTPDGLRRDDEPERAHAISSRTAKRLDLLTLGAVAALLLVIAADRWWPRGEPAATASMAPPQASNQTAPVDDRAIVSAPDGAPAPDIRPGIAVLPFANFSPDPDNAYFASGVHEEVLTRLSRIGALRVISRTSMERIAEEKLDAAAIGARLGVSHVLEGSVRRAGDRVRVTVQLIEAASDAHIWAENYDRSLDDVFAIQSDIALAIADRLELSLSAQLQADLGERSTRNQAAYELYLKALDNNRTWRFAAGFRDTIALLEPAVLLDPEFLAAQAMLAEAHGRLYWLREDPDGQHRDRARALVAQIGERWPDRPEAELARAQLSYTIDRDYGRALHAFQAARRRLPNDPAVLEGISNSLKRLGRREEFLAAARIALAADPESPRSCGEVQFALTVTGQYAEGVAFSEYAERKFPEDVIVAANAARLRALHQQDVQPLLELARRFPDAPAANLPPVILARFVSGDVDGALRLLDARPPSPANAAFRVELLQLAGRTKEAEASARSAYAEMHTKEDIYAPTVWNANLARLAAQAGDHEAARAWEARATSNPPASTEEADLVAAGLSGVRRARGDAEAAWQMVSQGSPFGPGYLTLFRPYYDGLYGESASYRAHMAAIEVGR